ncbi:MAG: hypothetical protein KF855_05740 [Acidobacteria bacterium]|nr:hypothetical protein [Acidobacteriota bacterium]
MILFRPVGLEELGLIHDLNFQGFPPRLPEQPIFYPVLNSDYAEQIARDWNTKSNSFAGYVTRFSVEDRYVSKFDRHIVGSSKHEELWVPAEELDNFNKHIESVISVDSAFFGDGFVGFIPDKFGLVGKTALEQLQSLSVTLDYSSFDFCMEIFANAKAIFLNYHFWEKVDPSAVNLSSDEKDKLLKAIRDAWEMRKSEISLI